MLVVSTMQDVGWEATARAKERGEAAELGSWRYTVQLEREEDRKSLVNNVVGIVIGLIVATASIAFLLRARPEALGIVLGGVALSVLGLGFLGICSYRLLFARRQGFGGILLGHVFAEGLVLERTGGSCHVVPRAPGALRYVSWEDEADERTREQLWITLPDGTLRGIETWNSEECRELAHLAAHFGLPAEPEPIAPVHSADIPELL